MVQKQMSFKDISYQWFRRRCCFWSSGGPPVRWSETIYAILKDGIMGNIHVKLYEIWTNVSGDVT